MKTKELIEMLQKEDPSGEGHIRMGDCCVDWYVMGCPGYYDGSYTYLDEDGNYVTSTEGYKVDIRGIDIHDFIEEHEDLTLEEVKEKFVFKMGNHLSDYQKEKQNKILEKVEKVYNENQEIKNKIENERKNKNKTEGV